MLKSYNETGCIFKIALPVAPVTIQCSFMHVVGNLIPCTSVSANKTGKNLKVPTKIHFKWEMCEWYVLQG